MGIRLDPETKDAQGFPVVSWEEDRNLFAPEGYGRARVTCFIRPDKEGVLQFVSVGSVRHGAFEEARPWQALVSFAVERAEQHYYSAADRALLDALGSKSKISAARVLMTDGAQVMLANFGDERPGVPMHLNCADAAPVEVALLHDRLSREFIHKRDALVLEYCGGEFKWPEDKAPFAAHVPPTLTAPPAWHEWVSNLIVAAVVALLGFGFYWLLLR
jgi:hypothetical protein